MPLFILSGDTLAYNNNRPFSTKDADHDTSYFSCSRLFLGAWWYGYCSLSNLNGHYYQEDERVNKYSGVMWSTWTGFYGSLKRATMKMRPAEFTPGEKLMLSINLECSLIKYSKYRKCRFIRSFFRSFFHLRYVQVINQLFV